MPEEYRNLVNRALRDHEGFTGDGHGGVGDLPIGDRSTARKPIEKRDLRELFLAADGAAEVALDAAAAAAASAASATGTPQYVDIETAEAATVPAFAVSIIVDGLTYVKDPSGTDLTTAGGVTWRLAVFGFHGRFEQMVARMNDGETVRIAAYGDSTTDGNNTTGWTANPTDGSGNAIGLAAHTPPNAWPAIAQSALRRMFGNNNISVWNAGYGGKAIVDGWALDNFLPAIINNPGYGIPHAVVLNFGINDARRAGYTPALFRTRLRALFALIGATGAFPIIMTPDATSADDDANGAVLSGLIEVYKSVAREFGVKLIDSHQAQLDLWSARGDTHRWVAEQADGIHGDDNLHSLKGAYIAASLFPNTLWLDESPVADVAPWSKYANTGGLTYTRGSVTNKFGASMNVAAGAYTPGQSLQKLWVWNTATDRDVHWCSVDGDGYYSPRPLANAPQIGVYDYLGKINTTHASPSAGWVAPAGGRRASEAPGRIKRLPVGLTRLLFNAPTDNTSSPVYVGYFSFRRPKRIAQAHILTHAGTGMLGADDWPNANCPTLIGFGSGVTLDAFYQFTVSGKAGVFFWSGETFGGVASVDTPVRRGVMLFRNSDTLASLYDAHLYSDGTAAIVNSALATAAVTAAFWDAGKVRVRGTVSSGDQIIRVYNGWTSLTPLMTVTIPTTAPPLLWGGSPGAAFSNLGSAGTTIATCDLVAVEYS